MKQFRLSAFVTVLALTAAYLWGGVEGLAIAGLLSVMEVSLSFDNAVVNAGVLQDMSEKWQRRFLTWGILVAVVGMRLVFPVLIVSMATGQGLGDVVSMALHDQATYSSHVAEAHVQIASFGSMFLLLVFLHFLCDPEKGVHWIGPIERRLAKFGRVDSVQMMLAFGALLVAQYFLPVAERSHSLIAGGLGIMMFIIIKGVSGMMVGEEGADHSALPVRAGVMGFIYLEVLDASFSLDGVVGAFAMSNDIVIIMLGLGIGAMFVRSLTLYLVHKGTLQEFIYLEHGAHWGIGALATIMLVSLAHPVSELVTGLVGVGCIVAALLSSILYRRKEEKDKRFAEMRAQSELKFPNHPIVLK